MLSPSTVDVFKLPVIEEIMMLKRAMLSVFGLAVLFGSLAPAEAQYHHRHCFYRHHHRVCR